MELKKKIQLMQIMLMIILFVSGMIVGLFSAKIFVINDYRQALLDCYSSKLEFNKQLIKLYEKTN